MITGKEHMETIVEILKRAEQEADEIIGQTSVIRESVSNGRPNSSQESTPEGVLNALRIWLDTPLPGQLS
jgi:hypothetical protein